MRLVSQCCHSEHESHESYECRACGNQWAAGGKRGSYEKRQKSPIDHGSGKCRENVGVGNTDSSSCSMYITTAATKYEDNIPKIQPPIPSLAIYRAEYIILSFRTGTGSSLHSWASKLALTWENSLLSLTHDSP